MLHSAHAVILLVVTAVVQSIAASPHLQVLQRLTSSLAASNNESIHHRRGYEEAYAFESSFWVSNPVSTDVFYQAPVADGANPGHILRFEEVTQENLTSYLIPPGIAMYRMLYQSLDMDNMTVPASAIILIPYSRAPRRTPVRVIVWAHGTAGLKPQCAPSNHKVLLYGITAPFAMIYRGYAVIAVDYAGLGSNTTFNYLAGPSHAADISYAVKAAQRALPKGLITREWVVVGHSEGGLAAWATNEREVVHPTGGFLGAVAIAPTLQELQIMRYGIENGGLTDLFSVSYALTAIARLNSLIDPALYYSRIGLERIQLAEKGCICSLVAALGNLTFSDVFDDEGWIYSDWAAAWEQRTGVDGHEPLAQPMLVIQASEDAAAYPATQDTVLERHCKMYPNASIHISPYPGMGHITVLGVSQVEYFDWINSRFHGKVVKGGCTKALTVSGETETEMTTYLRQHPLTQS
jgi:pimeloyl-ACP methyl ester carboxylesterase